MPSANQQQSMRALVNLAKSVREATETLNQALAAAQRAGLRCAVVPQEYTAAGDSHHSVLVQSEVYLNMERVSWE